MEEPADRVTLLGGRVILYQPRQGYRAAIDPVLLAAAVPARAGERVLDLGCGAGAALLCLAARCPDVVVTGLERQPAAAGLARQGLAANGWAGRGDIVEGDLLQPPPTLMANSFDHVMTNPPFWEAGRHSASPRPGKAASHGETGADLAAFIQAALRFLRSRGSLCIIYPTDRMDNLLALLAGRFGDIEILPLWPRTDQPAKRIIVRAWRDRRGPTRLLPGLVLHGDGQAYSPLIESVLRDGVALPLPGQEP